MLPTCVTTDGTQTAREQGFKVSILVHCEQQGQEKPQPSWQASFVTRESSHSHTLRCSIQSRAKDVP